MPDPKSLKVVDLIRFVALPKEWSHPGYTIQRDSIAFMKVMIKRTWPSRVFEIDDYGCPWVYARIYQRGKMYHHYWAITEATGWRRIKPRA